MILAAVDPGEELAIALFFDGILRKVYFRDFLPVKVDRAAIEWPVYYPGGAPPSALIQLAFTAGGAWADLGRAPFDKVPTVAVPKSVIQRRVRKRLNGQELFRLDSDLVDVPESYRNNCYDAVRHGLVDLGRMPR